MNTIGLFFVVGISLASLGVAAWTWMALTWRSDLGPFEDIDFEVK